MTRLSFKKELYSRQAVEQAASAFEDHAELSRSDDDVEWFIDVSADADEGLIADELANYALGLSIELRGGPS